jgi:transcriptional regulator with XRE-family HTH domain
MAKKRTTIRKAGRGPGAAGRALASSKKYRSAVVATIDTLPIVETRSGRALALRARLDMSRETFARLVPMSTRNLANIEAGKTPSAAVLRQFKELRRVIDALSEVIQNDAIGPWLEQPNEAFNGLKPIEVIERGEVDRIWQMIYYLRSGVPS